MYLSQELYMPIPDPYNVAIGRISKDQWIALQEHILDTINRATTATDMAVFIAFINVPQDSFNFMTRDEVQQETRAALLEISFLQHYLEEIANHDLDDLMKTCENSSATSMVSKAISKPSAPN